MIWPYIIQLIFLITEPFESGNRRLYVVIILWKFHQGNDYYMISKYLCWFCMRYILLKDVFYDCNIQ